VEQYVDKITFKTSRVALAKFPHFSRFSTTKKKNIFQDIIGNMPFKNTQQKIRFYCDTSLYKANTTVTIHHCNSIISLFCWKKIWKINERMTKTVKSVLLKKIIHSSREERQIPWFSLDFSGGKKLLILQGFIGAQRLWTRYDAQSRFPTRGHSLTTTYSLTSKDERTSLVMALGCAGELCRLHREGKAANVAKFRYSGHTSVGEGCKAAKAPQYSWHHKTTLHHTENPGPFLPTAFFQEKRDIINIATAFLIDYKHLHIVLLRRA